MTFVKPGQTPPNPAPNAGTGTSPPLPFKAPIGRVRVYFIGQKTYKTKAGPTEKTVIHYDKDGQRFAFATNRADVVADLVELGKLMAPTDGSGKLKPVTAVFEWVKGESLTLRVE